MLIQQALLRLDPTTSTFTSLHLLFVKLCLRSRAYNEALRILDNDIYHIAPSKSRSAERQQRPLCSQKNASPTFITQEAGFSTTIEYRHHLLYHLYGAMLYIGAKNWERALLFLEIVMSCPTPNTASMIQVEAYKKWVLVCLLQHGKVLSIPRGASSAATKNYRSLSKPYEAIGEAFKNTEQQKLRAEATAGENIWQQVSNCRTSKQCSKFRVSANTTPLPGLQSRSDLPGSFGPSTLRHPLPLKNLYLYSLIHSLQSSVSSFLYGSAKLRLHRQPHYDPTT